MTTLTREQQINLGKKICLLLQEKYGAFFASSNEGSGKVATLKITSGDKKKINYAKSYLFKTFGLKMKKVFKNHGNGINFTILIDLSDVSVESQERIWSVTKPILEKANGNGKESLSVVPVVSVPENISPSTEIIPEEVVKIEKDHDLKSLIASITWMLKFERMSSGSFLCNRMAKGEYWITCNSADIASKIYSYLSWFVGNPTLVVAEKDVIIVDYAKRNKIEKSLEKTHFCLPPAGAADSNEVKRRLTKIISGSRPDVSAFEDGKFLVSYVRSNFVKKIFSVLVSMGWFVEMKDRNSFLVSVEVNQLAVDSTPKDETIPIVEKEEVSTPSTDRDKFELVIAQNPANFFLGVGTKEEAFAELEKLFGDSELFIKLSPPTQQRITAVLKEEARKRNPEEYAQNLLSIIGK